MGTSTTERLRAAAIAARNLILGGNATTLAMGSPVAMAHYASEAIFLRRALSGRRGLPEQPIWEALGATATADIRLPNVASPSWPAAQTTYLADIVNLCRLCAALRPMRVFEIGTYLGYSTLHLACNVPPGGRVHTLDLPKQATPAGDGAAVSLRTTFMDDAHIRGATASSAYLFTGTEVEDRIDLLFGDSASFDFAPYRGAIDLFFIDGAHSYEYVRSDTLQALRCVRPGGVIAWHDFGRAGLNGVSRWLREMRADGWPVVAAPGGSLAYMIQGPGQH